MKPQMVCLIIRDGWGQGKEEDSNAIYKASTPFADEYEKEFPTTLIQASGKYVGLPEGLQGNSEVGHLNIGAGRVVYQSLTRIDKSIDDGDFYDNKALLDAIHIAKERGSSLHLAGLIQEAGVHAVTRHAIEIIKLCKSQGLEDVLIHAITDGRDTPPKSAEEHLSFLHEAIDDIGTGRIASVMGRYYAMDRDNRWERTELAYKAMINGTGKPVENWREAIEDAYASGETDEFIKPRVIDYAGIQPDDVFVFFNFRFDRTRQLTKAMVEPDFVEFPTFPHELHFVAMTHYYDGGNFEEAFPEIDYKNTLGEVLAEKGIPQFRCSETEKYAHVTFFFNALQNDPFVGEEQALVPSPRVATYDLQPEMNAAGVTKKVLEAVHSEKYKVIVCNYANCDMVGHTGIFPSIVKAVETVDQGVRQVVEAVREKGGVAIVTADHGNAEQTKLEDGTPMTSHTTNPVPLTVVGAGEIELREDGRLSDIAPTILQLLDIPLPEEMTGTSLIKE